MNNHLAQARLLLQTRHYAEAESALRQALAAHPNDPDAHALLALALYALGRNDDALREAHLAVGLAPDQGFPHYVRALILLDDRQADDALRAVHEALRLDPTSARYHALLGRIYLRKRDWQRALAAAEAGLQFDPEHVACLNVRAQALVKLGRMVEADAALAVALTRDPENALTHANHGWALLHRGDHAGAFAAFREALWLDPTSGWARAGIVEALKARNWLYRLLLRYFLWMSRLTDDEQWQFIGGLYALRVGLRAIARVFPPLWIVVLPLLLLYRGFFVLTWIARPLFALVLRFDRLGRLALPRADMVASTWMAVCLLSAEAGVLAALLVRNPAFLVLTVGALAMLVPVAGVFHVPAGTGRVGLSVYSALLVLVVLAALAAALAGGPVGVGLVAALALVFGFGWTVYLWVANLVVLLAA